MGNVPLEPGIEEGSDPLRFAFWDVGAGIVRDNLARYARETGTAVEADCIPGAYEEVLAAAFQRGAGPDVFYAQRAEASLWAACGWIEPIPASDPAIEPWLHRMNREVLRGSLDPDGRLLGTTYYNAGPFALFQRPGADHPIQDWGDVLDVCRRARREGVSDHPFVPRWHATQTGLIWSLLCHLATDGVTSLDDERALVVLVEAVDFFASLVAEDLVPPGSLDDRSDEAALRRWASGRHLLTFTMDYLAADAGVLAGRPVSVPLARLPGRTGTPLMPGHALICVRAGLDKIRRDKALRLAVALGGPAFDGDLRVHRRWLQERLFPVPFPELERDDVVRDELLRFFPPTGADEAARRLLDGRRRAVVSPVSHVPFMLEWSAGADRILRDALRERFADPARTAEAILMLWNACRAHWVPSS